MKLITKKQVEIEIKDNDHCSSGCHFMEKRAIDFCVLYGGKEIECVNMDFKRLQECKDDFGVIGENGWIYGRNWINTNPNPNLGRLHYED